MNLSIIKRLLSETSPFFKKVQIFLVSAMGLINGFSSFIPAHILLIANTACIVGIILSSLTVKDAALFNNGITVDSLVTFIDGIKADVQQVKDAVAGKISVEQATAIAKENVLPPPPSVVVTAQEATVVTPPAA